MRAAVATGINETDPLSILELRDDWPDPIAPEGQHTRTTRRDSINMHDLWSMRGVGVRADQFPTFLGCDIAGWDPDGNAVIVSGSFGNPDAGHGHESFDPDRALVSERFPGSFRRVLDRAGPQHDSKAGVHVDGRSRMHHCCLDDCIPNVVHTGHAEAGETVLIQGAGGELQLLQPRSLAQRDCESW